MQRRDWNDAPLVGLRLFRNATSANRQEPAAMFIFKNRQLRRRSSLQKLIAWNDLFSELEQDFKPVFDKVSFLKKNKSVRGKNSEFGFK